MFRLMVIILAILIVIGLIWFSLFSSAQSPSLSVLFRCAPGAGGKLAIQGPAIETERKLTAGKACAAGDVVFENFNRDEALSIIFQSEEGESITLNVQELNAIHLGSDDSYYVILNVTKTKPYISIGVI